MTTKALLAEEISKVCCLKGHFRLRSGQTSKEYFDKYALEASPKLLSQTAELMASLIPKETDLLAGLEMGGLPLVTALSLKTGLACRFVRKKTKSYGTERLCEGGPIEGKKLCLIEDVITTGGQALESLKMLKKEGSQIVAVLCVVHRGDSVPEGFKTEGVPLLKLFSKSDLFSS